MTNTREAVAPIACDAGSIGLETPGRCERCGEPCSTFHAYCAGCAFGEPCAPCTHKRCRGGRCRVPQQAHKRLARQLAGKLMRWGMRETDGLGFVLADAGLVGIAIASAPMWVR